MSRNVPDTPVVPEIDQVTELLYKFQDNILQELKEKMGYKEA